MMDLTAENVRAVATAALFTDAELIDDDTIPDGAVVVDGIMARFAFHPVRIVERKADIAALLDGLPDTFKTDGGGGMSFLEACMTKAGVHWAEHPTMETLFALGIGAGLAVYTMPRDLWGILPGGMPYITIDSAALLAAIAEGRAS